MFLDYEECTDTQFEGLKQLLDECGILYEEKSPFKQIDILFQPLAEIVSDIEDRVNRDGGWIQW